MTAATVSGGRAANPPGGASGRAREFPRVVISGMGVISAAGLGVEALWRAARDGSSQIRELTLKRPYDGRIKTAAQVQNFNAAEHVEESLLPLCDPFTAFSIVAADQAMAQAGFAQKDLAGPRTALLLGTGIGGAETIDNGLYTYYRESSRMDPLSIPKLIPSSAPTTLGIRYSVLGPTFSICSACSSATQAIGLGLQMIRFGLADRAIVGGSEACVINGPIRAWEALRVLTPEKCRPFSKGRNGMTLGEGAAMFILETAESAKARGHRPLCELKGYGTTSDAKDPVRPDLAGVASAMATALEDAQIAPDEIDYINAHGTATHANDITESEAILNVFGEERGRKIPVSSTKPIHGHALGASGGLELAITISAMRDGIIPPTINFLEADPRCPVDPVPNVARPAPIRAAISNSFAFGGINAVLVLKALHDEL